MYFTDEKDYIMRMIKEMVRVLFSLMFGKKYVSVELEKENKYEVSGKNLKNFLDMIDSGEINEAENILLDSIDYTDRNEVMAAALFYQYLSEKDSEFLKNNNYTKEEVMSGFKQLLMQSGYTDLLCLKGCFDTLSISDFCFIGFHRQLDPFNSSLLTEMFF